MECILVYSLLFGMPKIHLYSHEEFCTKHGKIFVSILDSHFFCICNEFSFLCTCFIILFFSSLDLKCIMQYKFYVDGEWRHDERQPSVIGSYGTVNTIFVTQEPDSAPMLSSLGGPESRKHMDVDHDSFHHVVSSMSIWKHYMLCSWKHANVIDQIQVYLVIFSLANVISSSCNVLMMSFIFWFAS